MQRHPEIGTCPECGVGIGSTDVLITYQTDERIQHYAECPGCGTVVHPEQPSQ